MAPNGNDHWREASLLILEELRELRAVCNDQEARLRALAPTQQPELTCPAKNPVGWFTKTLSVGGIITLVTAILTVTTMWATEVASVRQIRVEINQLTERLDAHDKAFVQHLLQNKELEMQHKALENRVGKLEAFETRQPHKPDKGQPTPGE